LKKKNIEEDLLLMEKEKEIAQLKDLLEKKIKDFDNSVKLNKLKDEQIEKLTLSPKKDIQEVKKNIPKNDIEKSVVKVNQIKNETNKEILKSIKTKENPPINQNMKTNLEENLNKFEKVSVPVKVVDNILSANHGGNNIPVITSSSNKKPNEFQPLFCIDINGEDNKHFQMNYEKCKELNNIYMNFVSYLHSEIQVLFYV